MTTAVFLIILHCDNFQKLFTMQNINDCIFHQILANKTLNTRNKIEKHVSMSNR